MKNEERICFKDFFLFFFKVYRLQHTQDKEKLVKNDVQYNKDRDNSWNY